MKAIRVHEHGGPEVLRYEDIPLPTPDVGEARVKTEAAGVNFIDIYVRTGQYKTTLPVILGQEAAGVVDAVGLGVTEVKVGDRVAVYAPEAKAYAEYAFAPAWRMIPVPDPVSSRQAAAIMVQGLTAHYLVSNTFPLESGQTALIHAAAGGVGHLLIQMAKLRGARVIGTVSTDDKARLARELGADDVILYTEADFQTEVKRLTDGRGVDVVYDSVGKDTFDKSLNCLKRRGYMVLFGQSSGRVPPLDPQVLNAKGSLFLTRPTLGHYLATREETLWRGNEVFDWMASGKLKVLIDKTFPLAEAGEAQSYLASRRSKGKILLVP
jgi:NADPH2:quinone reductase